MRWTKVMPEKAGYYWFRMTVDKFAREPVLVHIDAEPGCLPEMKLVGSASSYTYREAEKELLEVYKSAKLEFMGPIVPPEE